MQLIVFNLRYIIPKEIPQILHSGSNHNCPLMVNHLHEKLNENKFNCLDEKTVKYISFSLGLKKNEMKINRKTKEQTKKHIRFYIKFIYSVSFKSTLLSSNVIDTRISMNRSTKNDLSLFRTINIY